MRTGIGTLVGFFSTLGIAFALCYAADLGMVPPGPGMIPPLAFSGFAGASVLQQLNSVFGYFLLNIIEAYILAPLVWLVGGLIGGLITRDILKGVAAGLITASITPLLTWIIAWAIIPGPLDPMGLLDQALLYQLLNWVINGILAGIIAAVGGAVGGTLTSLRETR